MFLESLTLRNFRGYKEATRVDFENLTAFIGRNDIGKSTILEALDIFFNNGKGIIKIEKSDANIVSSDDTFEISVEFKGFPKELIVDSTVKTTLNDEFLLNLTGNLEIKKYYKNGALKNTVIVANYPNNIEVKELHSKKIVDLKRIADSLGVDVEDKRKSSLYRKEILKGLSNKILEQTEICIDGEGGKQIWASLEQYLPLYSLFQSDRKNGDGDNEIQDPVKFAISEVLKNSELTKKLDEVYDEVIKATTELTNLTIKKLEEMNPEIAKELKPNFKKPVWDKVFTVGLDSDLNIPLNKRGSGVRRLILLNFFRAEAERRKNERGVPNIIYAFEEPETSQHPRHQKILIESFLELSKHDINQIIFTTHSPEIAKMIPVESLRLIERKDENTIINPPLDSTLEKIVEELGVLPSIDMSKIHNVKVAICVEGKNDITFLNNISKSVPELKNIIDINTSECIILPMGGSTLQFWINNRYLSKLNLAQVHIYDSDVGSKEPHKYKKYIDEINELENSIAFETSVREMENFISSEIFLEKYPKYASLIEEGKWEEKDVPELLAKITHMESESDKSWEDVEEDKKKKKISKAKNKLNEEFILELDKQSLENKNQFKEIENWFKAIKSFVE